MNKQKKKVVNSAFKVSFPTGLNGIFRNMKIRTRILGSFLLILTFSIALVAGTIYYIGKNNLENIAKNQLANSVRAVTGQISLLSGAYTSKEFPEKLNYVLTSEQAGIDNGGLKAQIMLFDSELQEINWKDSGLHAQKSQTLPESLLKQIQRDKHGSIDQKIGGQSRTLSYGYILEKDWFYVISVSREAYLKPVYDLLWIAIASGIVSLILAFLLSFTVTRGFIDSIKEISRVAALSKKGDFTNRVRAAHGGPEILNLSENFNSMLDNYNSMIGELGSYIDDLTGASNELTNIASESDASSSNIMNMTNDLAASSEAQKDTVADLKVKTDHVLNGIQDIAAQVINVSRTSEIMMKTVNDGMAEIRDLNVKIKDIEDVSQHTVNYIQNLDSHSKEIFKIMSAIKHVSDQTKLLSLNAAIEAARAGEFGSGFRVVAREIQLLAEEAAQSVREVGKIVNEINEGTEAVLNIASRGRNISEEGSIMAQNTNDAFEIIMRNVEQTHMHIAQISNNALTVSNSVEEFSKNIDNIANIITVMADDSQEIDGNIEKHKNLTKNIFLFANNLSDMANLLNKLKNKMITK